MLLTLILMFSFPSCGREMRSSSSESLPNQVGKEVDNPNAPADFTENTDIYENPGAVFSRELLLLPDADVSLIDAVKSGDRIYMYGTATDRDRCFIYRLNSEDHSIEEIAVPSESGIYRICASADDEVCVLQLDADGGYILHTLRHDDTWATMALPHLAAYEESVITRILAAENGYVVFTALNVLILDKQGNLVRTLVPDCYYGSCFLQAGGTVVVAAQIQSKLGQPSAITRTIVLDTDLNSAAQYDSASSFSSFLDCVDSKHALLCQNAETVFLFDYASDSVQPLINSSLSGMTPSALLYISDGLYFSITGGAPYLWQPAQSDSGVTLTLASYMPDTLLKEYVNLYNSTNHNYKIRILDYSIYDSGGESQGLARLRTDIIAGRTPDMYDASVLPTELYAQKGIFEDIKPYLSPDAPVSSDMLISSALSALEYEEHLYYITPTFEVFAMCGDTATVGSKGYWTTQDFFSAIEKIPPQEVFGAETTKYVFLSYILSYIGQEYIDTDTLRCHFDSPDFQHFLEFASNLPDECDYSRLSSTSSARAYVGAQKLLFEQFGKSAITIMSFADAIFGGQAQFVGFPSNSSSGIALMPHMLVSMCPASAHKDGVMDFVYFLLSDEVQSSVLFCPILKSAMESCMTKWERQYSEYPPILYTSYDGVSVEIQGDIDAASAKSRLADIIERIDCTTLYSEDILSIIYREAQPYFQGAMPVTQAVRNIQSKVQLYISEQFS